MARTEIVQQWWRPSGRRVQRGGISDADGREALCQQRQFSVEPGGSPVTEGKGEEGRRELEMGEEELTGWISCEMSLCSKYHEWTTDASTLDVQLWQGSRSCYQYPFHNALTLQLRSPISGYFQTSTWYI